MAVMECLENERLAVWSGVLKLLSNISAKRKFPSNAYALTL